LRRSVIGAIFRVLWDSDFIMLSTMTSHFPLTSPVQTFPFCLFKIQINIILPPMPSSSKFSLPFTFSPPRRHKLTAVWCSYIVLVRAAIWYWYVQVYGTGTSSYMVLVRAAIWYRYVQLYGTGTCSYMVLVRAAIWYWYVQLYGTFR
jgi:hypothetical protein